MVSRAARERRTIVSPGAAIPVQKGALGQPAWRPLSLRVFGRLPVTGVWGRTEAGVRKASREETAAGVRTDATVGLWGFAAGAWSDLSVPNRDDG
jgi:hypothetical protein